MSPRILSACERVCRPDQIASVCSRRMRERRFALCHFSCFVRCAHCSAMENTVVYVYAPCVECTNLSPFLFICAGIVLLLVLMMLRWRWWTFGSVASCMSKQLIGFDGHTNCVVNFGAPTAAAAAAIAEIVCINSPYHTRASVCVYVCTSDPIKLRSRNTRHTSSKQLKRTLIKRERVHAIYMRIECTRSATAVFNWMSAGLSTLRPFRFMNLHAIYWHVSV